MQKTTNYQLNQWEPSDPIRREDFNQDNAAIDAALAANAKALSDYRTANDAAVAAVQKSVTNQGTSLAALTAGLGSGGYNARIAWGTYTGTGVDETIGLTFEFYPVAVFIGNNGTAKSSYNPSVFLRGRSSAHPDRDPDAINHPSVSLTWRDNGVSWSSAASVEHGLNAEGTVYYYVAIGCDMSEQAV